MTRNKTYNRTAISRILSKASEIQASQDIGSDQEGLSEAELLHVAEEVGISEQALKEALLNHDSLSPPDEFNWLLGTGKLQKSSVIQGEIDEEQWENVVQEIRKLTGGIGKIKKIGNSLEWEQRRKEIGYRHLSIKPRNGKTTVQYTYNWWGVKFYSMMVPFILSAVITAIGLDGSSFSDIQSLLITLGGGIIGLPFGRMYLKSYFNRQKQMVSSLFSSINKIMKDSPSPDITIEDKDSYDATSSPALKNQVRSSSS